MPSSAALGKGVGIGTVSPPTADTSAMPQPPATDSSKYSRGPSVTIISRLFEEIFWRPSRVISAEPKILGGDGGRVERKASAAIATTMRAPNKTHRERVALSTVARSVTTSGTVVGWSRPEIAVTGADRP